VNGETKGHTLNTNLLTLSRILVRLAEDERKLMIQDPCFRAQVEFDGLELEIDRFIIPGEQVKISSASIDVRGITEFKA
jgi:hypothetical protein